MLRVLSLFKTIRSAGIVPNPPGAVYFYLEASIPLKEIRLFITLLDLMAAVWFHLTAKISLKEMRLV